MFDLRDVHHAGAATAVRAGRAARAKFSVPSVVLAQVLVGAARRSATEQAKRRRQVVAAFGPIRVIDEAVAVQAATIRARQPSIRLPDALVLAVGVIDEAAEIFTCDPAWARCDPRVVVIG